ncbi:MAG: triose-phosphate isomerase [Patescibacteria group bacterium]
MNKKIIIANWKMNLSPQEHLVMAETIKKGVVVSDNREVVLCPSFTSLSAVGEVLKRSSVQLGAQDAFWDEVGAYTGEESPKTLRELGCRYVIIGHSERRNFLGETDQMINKKLKAVLASGLRPVLCVGETLEERQAKKTDLVIFNQLTKDLFGIHLLDNEQVVIAYEPIWAIGTGQTVMPDQAEQVFRVIRQNTIDLWPKLMANNNVRIIYGGSANENNYNNFIKLEHCAGFLVGTASLKAENFLAICNGVN